MGIPGSLEIGVMNKGEVRPIGFLSGLEDDVKANYADYAMKPIEVTCMMFTPDGNLRHAKLIRMRDDIPSKIVLLRSIWASNSKTKVS